MTLRFRPALALLLLAVASCGGGESDTSPQGGAGEPAAAVDPDAAPGGATAQSSLAPSADAGADDRGAGARGADDPLAERRMAEIGTSRSRLVFETVERDLGMVYQDEDVPVEFPFRVDGPDPVILVGQGLGDHLPVSCGCTDAHVRPDWLGDAYDVTIHGERWDLERPIPAGAEGTVVATFHGNRYERTKRSTVTVRGNMQGGPYLLEVIAHVKPVFESRPTQIMFGRALAGSLRASDPSVLVEVRAKDAFEVARWKNLPLGVAVEQVGEPQLEADGRTLQSFRFTLGPEAKVGMLNAAAIAETSLGADYEIVMSGQVVGPVRFRPENRLMFGFWDAGSAQTRTVKVDLQVTGGELPEPKVTLEGSLAEHCTVEIVEVRASESFEIRVTAGSDTPPGNYDGVLKMDFGDGAFPSHQLTMRAVVREASP
jgi:hypothetical protein